MINLERFKHKSWLDGRIVAINADCQEVMAEIGDKEVDLILTDPPYGINMDGGNVGYKGLNNFEKKDWDKERPKKLIFDKLFRVGKNQIIWGGNYFADYLPPSRCYIVWDKGEGFYSRTYAECEIAYSSFDKNARIFKHDPLSKGDYKGKIHPTQKPVALMIWCLNNYSKENDLVFDAFSGSFTTAIACIRTKRRFIGCELDKEYFEKACERIDTELKQLTLF